MDSWFEELGLEGTDKLIGTMDRVFQISMHRPVTPCMEDMLKAFKMCPYESLKSIFIGQDPYPQPGVATGILFGNKNGTKIPSVSLVKVEDVLRKDGKKDSFDMTCESWATQGVLMINSALSVEINRPGSHFNIWLPFMSFLLHKVSTDRKHIAYVLFGNNARDVGTFISRDDNLVLSYYHPVYAARKGIPWECDGFRKVNSYLKSDGVEAIHW